MPVALSMIGAYSPEPDQPPTKPPPQWVYPNPSHYLSLLGVVSEMTPVLISNSDHLCSMYFTSVVSAPLCRFLVCSLLGCFCLRVLMRQSFLSYLPWAWSLHSGPPLPAQTVTIPPLIGTDPVELEQDSPGRWGHGWIAFILYRFMQSLFKE